MAIYREKRIRRDIQVLRGLAVLAVVFFHASERVFPGGYLGVDVFFVISGFVVTPLILRIFEGINTSAKLSALKFFYKWRFYRLAPAFTFALIFSAAIVFLLGPIDDHQRFIKQGIATLLLVGNVGAYRYSGNYFSPNPNPLVHTWSLSVEEQFYLFFPLILFIILQKSKNFAKTTIIALVLIALLSLLSFTFPFFLQTVYSNLGINDASQFSFYSSIDRAWQFALGGLVSFSLNKFPLHKPTLIIAINLGLMTCLSIFLFGQFRTNSIVASFTVTLITVALIINKSVDLLPDVIFKRLEWLGDRSYSIYLYHMPLIYIARYSPVAQLGNVQNHLFYTFLAVVLSILLGALSYSKIESKFRKKASTNLPNHSIGIAITVTLFLPLALLMIMEVGQKNHYWGLDRNISKPSYAGFLDLKCARDSEKGPPCFYRESEHAKTVLLVGDSHAGQISQAVVDAAKIAKWNSVIWTHGGCNVQFRKRVNLKIPDSCIAVNNSMKEWVMENRPDAIIVSQFVELGDSIKDLKHALSVLHSLVPNTLIIENIPIFPEDKNFMVQRPIIMLPYQPLKEFDRDVMQLRNQSSSVELVDWARQYGISTMSFESLFCSTTTCKRFKNKKWLYRDSSHLSVAGAEFTIPMLTAYLKKL